MKTTKRYRKYTDQWLEDSQLTVDHRMSMTSEGLDSKSDMCAELAWRDEQIDAVEQKYQKSCRGWRESFDYMHRRAMAAENQIERMTAFVKKTVEKLDGIREFQPSAQVLNRCLKSRKEYQEELWTPVDAYSTFGHCFILHKGNVKRAFYDDRKYFHSNASNSVYQTESITGVMSNPTPYNN